MEKAAGFRFRLGQLEKLCKIEDEREFYLASASTAGFRFGEDKVEDAVEAKDSAYIFRWFDDVFPEYEKPAGSISEVKVDRTKGQEEKLVPHEKGVFVVRCPACGAGNLMEFHLEAEATRLPIEPGGEEFTTTPEALVWFSTGCHHCAKAFYTFVEPLDKKKYAVEGSLSVKLMKPKETAELFDLGVAIAEENVWQKIMDQKVVGPLSLPQGRGKKARKV